MKKLIAISVVFALVAGVAFAADVSGAVIGTANVLEGSTVKDSKVTSSANLGRVRLEGSGETGDGDFGGWVRVEGFDTAWTKGELTGHSWEGDAWRAFGAFGIAWWKPIDMFKLSIGANPDGHWGKEGVTAWMFYQTASDTGVVNPGNAWGGGYGKIVFRNAFFGGFGDERVFMTISPAEIVDINIGIPFFAKFALPDLDGDGESDGSRSFETADIFKKTVAQVDLKLDFGNIALTYKGDLGYDKEKGYNDPASIFVYYGGSFGDLSIDFGLGYTMAKDDGKNAQPIGVGLGVKYATESFGVKFRTVATLAGDDKETNILADVLPYYNISETLRAFVSVGLAMNMPEKGDSVTGWHFNPYLEVGSEWGPKFIAGIRAWSPGGKDAETFWAVPIALHIGF